MTQRIEKLTPSLFLDGPAEFLVKGICLELSAIKQWVALFGENIDPYLRMDYGERNLPAMRVYNQVYRKDFESWFIDGNIKIDLIYPASLRRIETQQIPDTVSAAVVQQFRSPKFFTAVGLRAPGLNELGKSVSVDKTLGFQWGDAIVPLTQIDLNFRMDLRIWDEYLESQGRTKDEPFEVTLANLERIVSQIQGLDDDDITVDADLGIDQKI